jgi:phage/conjugal plasmid C-4 type zinc finger TraR family protein
MTVLAFSTFYELVKKKEHAMAVGWSRDGAVQEQIDATVEDGVQLARSRLPDGESLTHCAKCEAMIPDTRRKAIPGVRFCVSCQSELEKEQTTFTLFNRRGSKDSQLK